MLQPLQDSLKTDALVGGDRDMYAIYAVVI